MIPVEDDLELQWVDCRASSVWSQDRSGKAASEAALLESRVVSVITYKTVSERGERLQLMSSWRGSEFCRCESKCMQTGQTLF